MPRKKIAAPPLSQKAEEEGNASELRLPLPKNLKKGAGISATYSAEESKARGYTCPLGDFLDGLYHGLVEKIEENQLHVVWVMPTGSNTHSMIDLAEGMDVTEQCAVTSIRDSPIPKAQLLRWKAKGVENAKTLPDETEEEEGIEEEGVSTETKIRYE